MRICSFIPSATEILFSLGLDEEVVAVSHACDYPDAVKSKPKVVRSRFDPEELSASEIDEKVRALTKARKGVYTVDLEVLKEAKPDVVITQELCNVCALPAFEVLNAIKVLPRRPRILTLKPQCLGDVLKNILEVGQMVGRSFKAEQLVMKLRRRIELVRMRTGEVRNRPRVVSLEWLDPLYCSGYWIPEMTYLAGGEDGLSKTSEPARRVSWTQVSNYDPDAIMIMPCGYSVERGLMEARRLRELPGWRNLPAVVNERVYVLDANGYYSRSGPRLINGLEMMAKLLHPALYTIQLPRGATAQVGELVTGAIRIPR
jgi:iron complex transport system substrate-binding protein